METWSVKQLIEEKYKTLGVPHFQRGLVWNNEAMALLLESLYYETPCGNLLLWKAKNPDKEGTPLPGAKKIEYLIIDGQQRIRILCSIFHAVFSKTGDDEGDWCLNLTALPEVERHLKADNRYRHLFHKVKNPGEKIFNLIPLKEIMTKLEIPDSFSKYIKFRGKVGFETVIKDCVSIKLMYKVNMMLKQKFPILTLDEDKESYSFAEVVKVYNRINSGGVRVAAEEKAFATLVSIRRESNKWLQQLFSEIHSLEKGSNTKAGLDRDHALRREKERSFGFKLFIRTLIQALSYHFNYSIGSGSFSFDVLGRNVTREQLLDAEKQHALDNVLDETSRILKYMRKLLAELNCDDLRFLPDTNSLVPVFQLLLTYPHLIKNKHKYGFLIKNFVVNLLLLNLTQRDLFKITKQIRETKYLSECLPIIDKFRIKRSDLITNLKNAKTLQSRYVLLLYWLERKNRAHDFSYKNFTKIKGRVKPLSTHCNPEKQHIIPYNDLKKIFGIDDKTRLSTHSANSIGNITYISHELNGYEKGLSDSYIKLEEEETEGRLNNLKAHFLYDEAKYNNRLKMRYHYNEIAANKDVLTNKRKKYQSMFEDFCKTRIEYIADGFMAWVEMISNEAEKIKLTCSLEPIEPQQPCFCVISKVQSTTAINKTINKTTCDKKLNTRWTPDLLREAYSGSEDAAFGLRMHKILDWALKNKIFMQAVAINPTFGIQGKSKDRIFSFYSGESLYCFLNEKHYLGGAQERNELVSQLKNLNLFEVDFDPAIVNSGRNMSRRIQELSDIELDQFLEVIREYCV